ncbi:hypothetical protein ACEQ8H_002607 [Pleosporales sp. CAS-2024a]
MSFKSTLVAAAAILASANAHMIMDWPVPYSADKIDNSPITAAQYPCKSNLGFTVTTMNSMAVGQKQTLSFKGSAVHGGGSCQLSVSTDSTPTASSVFKVIKSIEGACPGADKAETFDFELPASIPNGKATFAWTWFSKLSGQPELYMNCAPIEVTGGASDKTAFNKLPNMLVANIASTTCKSPPNKALKFPNPGTVLASGDNFSDVDVGSGDCGASAPQSSAAAPPSAPAGGQSPAAAPAPVVSAGPSNPGGVFAPGAAPLTLTTLVTVTVPTPAPSSAPVSPGTGTPAQPSSPSSGGGSAPAAPAPAAPGAGGSTCSTNGAVVCNGAQQFGLCNNGNVVWQKVAAGTACVNGVISKRSIIRVARPRYHRRNAN